MLLYLVFFQMLVLIMSTIVHTVTIHSGKVRALIRFAFAGGGKEKDQLHNTQFIHQPHEKQSIRTG